MLNDHSPGPPVRIGELRAWDEKSDRKGTFMVIDVNDFIVFVILQDGRRDGFYRSYVETHSSVVSESSQ